MSDPINEIVPLIRKHFDFLVSDYGFVCVRTWNEYMSRYQGAEYNSGRATILVEQADSPILDVRIMDYLGHRGHSENRWPSRSILKQSGIHLARENRADTLCGALEPPRRVVFCFNAGMTQREDL